MFFPDLEPYKYGVPAALPDVVTVGWLADDHDYPRGEISPRALATLERMLGTHSANQMRGFHVCELCGCDPAMITDPTGREILIGSAEIWVPSPDLKRIYAAPNLIHHYVSVHHYRPPDEFLAALSAAHTHPDWNAEEECETRMDAAYGR